MATFMPVNVDFDAIKNRVDNVIGIYKKIKRREMWQRGVKRGKNKKRYY